VEPTVLSLVPALLTVVLAFATRRVLPALFLGIVAGGVVLFMRTGEASDLNILNKFLIPALGSKSFAQILLIYLWCLGGLIGIWDRTGGAQHFAQVVGGRVARGPRSSLGFSWLMGVVFHQGGTVSTVLTGTTVKPVADAHGVSHEELAYVVDSTGSPVATVVPFNAWPAYISGLVVGTVPLLPDAQAGLDFYVRAIPYNFYGWFAVIGTGLFSAGWLPWVGKRMAAARTRARETGALNAADARPLMPPEESDAAMEGTDYSPSLADFLVPIGVLMGVAIVPYALTGTSWINEAFALCTLSAITVALIRGLTLPEVLDAFLRGCQKMTIGAVILGLAVTLGLVSKELDTATYVVSLLGSGFPAFILPAALTALCMGIAFATGTSWGTYAVVFPIAMPLAWALVPDPNYLHICFGAVLGGAVFGDQCSPISDTTILSSMFTGCDLMDHVKTQLPLALGAATLGAVASTLVALVAV
jgi:Na+/H+ antiporter NhaC